MIDDEIRIPAIEALHADAIGYRQVVRDIARTRPTLRARIPKSAPKSVVANMGAAIRKPGAPADHCLTERRLSRLHGRCTDRLSAGTPDGVGIPHGEPLSPSSTQDDFFLRL